MSAPLSWTVVGQGLAGTCLAWRLLHRGLPFTIADRGCGGSSRVAAGLINPVTGKQFEPSWRIDEFLPEAVSFYRNIEALLETTLWHPMPIVRLAQSDEEWKKIRSKMSRPDVARWIDAHHTHSEEGWTGAVIIKNGGRLDTQAFLDRSRAYFETLGVYQQCEVDAAASDLRLIRCDGAAGLMSGRLGPHRCAKGEILTLQAGGWDESIIRIGAGGWLTPLGRGRFKAGSTYEWNTLDESPTDQGREKVASIARRLGGGDFEIINHEAGVRPILRRSQPLIGPLDDGSWSFNGLGSKGSLYAPGIADRLVRWMIDGSEPDPELDLRRFLQNLESSG